MQTKNQRNNATLIHLSGLLYTCFPFGGILGPLLLWCLKKEDDAYLDQEGKSAVNFQLSMSLYILITGLLLVPVILSNFFGFVQPNQFIQISYDSYRYSSNLDYSQFSGILILILVIAFMYLIRFIFTINASLYPTQGKRTYYPLSIKFIK